MLLSFLRSKKATKVRFMARREHHFMSSKFYRSDSAMHNDTRPVIIFGEETSISRTLFNSFMVKQDVA